MRTSNEQSKTPVATLRIALVMGLVVLLTMFASTTMSRASSHTVDLGTATSFAILAHTSITFTDGANTTVTGDIGIHPGTSVTGYADIDHDGTLHVANGVALDAKNDLETAYNDAAGRTPTATLNNTELGGRTLGPGVYDSGGVLQNSGTLTLDGGPNDVWIFQSTGSLLFGPGSTVAVTNGADPCNVFWVVPDNATLDTTSTVVGTIMARTTIALNSGATIDGRLMSRTADVTSIANTITRSTCATSAASSSGQALRLVKFFFDADGNRVSAPAGDWTVTASVGGGSVIELDESTTSGWANVSKNYTVSESSLEGWPEAGCDGFTLPDIGTAYLDVSGTGDFTLTQDDRAHAVCNQADGTTTVEIPTRIDTGAGGTALPIGRQGMLLLVAVAGAGAFLARRYYVTNDA